MPHPLRFPSTRRQRRAWGLSIATVAFAGASLVLLPEPEADVDTSSGAPLPSAVPSVPLSLPALSPSTSLSPLAHVDLDGVGVDGSFGLATGAVRAGEASELLAELRLTGVGEGAHVPVSLAVVLDHSGSMSGEKMMEARESIVALLAAMADDDRLAVIVYDDTAEVLQPLAPARVLRRSLPDRVRRVQAEGGTNIPAGLALGIEALHEAPTGTAQRIILISDGRDGSGLSLTEIASSIATSADARVVTSSLGVGLDYDPDFMTAVADAGHGNYAFLEDGTELDAFLRRELDESSSTVAEALVAEITLPTGVRLVNAHGAVASQHGDAVRVELGALFGGERRKVTFELEARTDLGSLGAGLPLAVRLSYRSVRGGTDARPTHLVEGTVVAAVVASDDEVLAARDPELYPDAVATLLDAEQNVALAAWRSGDRSTARARSEAALGRYRREASAMPSPVFDARIEAIEAEMHTYDAVDPASSAGRSFGLGSAASRRAVAEAF